MDLIFENNTKYPVFKNDNWNMIFIIYCSMNPDGRRRASCKRYHEEKGDFN